MRRDRILSARGEVVDFDALAEKAKQKIKEQPKTVEVKRAMAEKVTKKKVNGFVPVIADEEATPAESAMIVSTFKKKGTDKKSAPMISDVLEDSKPPSKPAF